jgi:hypothetical protein
MLIGSDVGCRSGTMSFICEVRIRGRLSPVLRAEFEELGLAEEPRPAETALHGLVVDQAALHGLLRRIEALGLELVELRRCPPPPHPSSGAGPQG